MKTIIETLLRTVSAGPLGVIENVKIVQLCAFSIVYYFVSEGFIGERNAPSMGWWMAT